MGKSKKIIPKVNPGWREFAGVVHIGALVMLLVAGGLVSRNLENAKSPVPEVISQVTTQDLLEYLDKCVRYQNHFKAIHGKFARELSQLGVPFRLSNGSVFDLQKNFEIQLVDLSPDFFVIRARERQSKNQIFIDRKFHLSSNLNLPALSRAYLVEEGRRLLQLASANVNSKSALESLGLARNYWTMEVSKEGERKISGTTFPVLDEDAALVFRDSAETIEKPARSLASEPALNPYAAAISSGDEGEIRKILNNARYSELVYFRETGKFTNRWDDLDRISGFGFKDLTKSRFLRFHPIESSAGDFSLKIESAEGDNLGEQYLVSRLGEVQQIKYTDALLHQIKETTDLLQGSFLFQGKPENGPNR